MGLKSFWNKLYDTLSSVKTGIFLIIVVGIFSAIGTVILQRPTSEPEDLQRAYSPETLLWLDRLGLTDIFHSWWFLVLLVLFCVCLIFVSLSRWPNAWKMYSKPVRFATAPFRASLPFTAKFPVGDETIALNAAEKAFQQSGLCDGEGQRGIGERAVRRAPEVCRLRRLRRAHQPAAASSPATSWMASWDIAATSRYRRGRRRTS